MEEKQRNKKRNLNSKIFQLQLHQTFYHIFDIQNQVLQDLVPFFFKKKKNKNVKQKSKS